MAFLPFAFPPPLLLLYSCAVFCSWGFTKPHFRGERFGELKTYGIRRKGVQVGSGARIFITIFGSTFLFFVFLFWYGLKGFLLLRKLDDKVISPWALKLMTLQAADPRPCIPPACTRTTPRQLLNTLWLIVVWWSCGPCYVMQDTITNPPFNPIGSLRNENVERPGRQKMAIKSWDFLSLSALTRQIGQRKLKQKHSDSLGCTNCILGTLAGAAKPA